MPGSSRTRAQVFALMCRCRLSSAGRGEPLFCSPRPGREITTSATVSYLLVKHLGGRPPMNLRLSLTGRKESLRGFLLAWQAITAFTSGGLLILTRESASSCSRLRRSGLASPLILRPASFCRVLPGLTPVIWACEPEGCALWRLLALGKRARKCAGGGQSGKKRKEAERSGKKRKEAEISERERMEATRIANNT
jgi:hypothetical protein